jgi:hypothetical protein
MAVQLSRPALRLLSGPAARVGRRLVCLQGVGNWFPHASWWRRPRPEVTPCVAAHASVGVGGSPRETETCRARRRLVVGGPSSRKLVGGAPNWSGTGCLASEDLDRGPGSTSFRVLAFTLSILAFTLSMMSINLVLGEIISPSKGGPNLGPRHPCKAEG